MSFGYQTLEKHDWWLPENILYFSFKCTKLSMLAESEVVVFILSVTLIPRMYLSAVHTQCQGDQLNVRTVE